MRSSFGGKDTEASGAMRIGFGLAIAGAALLCACGIGLAQEQPKEGAREVPKIERANPFTPPPSAAEEQARQDERTRNIVWQLQPEIKSMIMQDVTASQAALEIKIRRRIDTAIEEAVKAAPASAAAGSPGLLGTLASATAPNPNKVPEGAKFISCVNGKALYRDKDNTLFQVAGDGVPGSDRCAK